MIGIIPRRGLSQIIACLGGSELTLEYVCHGLRDKSADGRRAHVVVWIRVSDVIQIGPAGGLRRKHRQINQASAVGQAGLSPRLT